MRVYIYIYIYIYVRMFFARNHFRIPGRPAPRCTDAPGRPGRPRTPRAPRVNRGRPKAPTGGYAAAAVPLAPAPAAASRSLLDDDDGAQGKIPYHIILLCQKCIMPY